MIFTVFNRKWSFSSKSEKKWKIDPRFCPTRKKPKNKAVEMNTKIAIFHFPRGYPGKIWIFDIFSHFSSFLMIFWSNLIKIWSKSWFWVINPIGVSNHCHQTHKRSFLTVFWSKTTVIRSKNGQKNRQKLHFCFQMCALLEVKNPGNPCSF